MNLQRVRKAQALLKMPDPLGTEMPDTSREQLNNTSGENLQCHHRVPSLAVII